MLLIVFIALWIGSIALFVGYARETGLTPTECCSKTLRLSLVCLALFAILFVVGFKVSNGETWNMLTHGGLAAPRNVGKPFYMLNCAMMFLLMNSVLWLLVCKVVGLITGVSVFDLIDEKLSKNRDLVIKAKFYTVYPASFRVPRDNKALAKYLDREKISYKILETQLEIQSLDPKTHVELINYLVENDICFTSCRIGEPTTTIELPSLEPQSLENLCDYLTKMKPKTCRIEIPSLISSEDDNK